MHLIKKEKMDITLMLEEIGFSDEYSRLSFLKKNTFDFEYPQNLLIRKNYAQLARNRRRIKKSG